MENEQALQEPLRGDDGLLWDKSVPSKCELIAVIEYGAVPGVEGGGGGGRWDEDDGWLGW